MTELEPAPRLDDTDPTTHARKQGEIPVERQDVFGATVVRLPDGTIQLWTIHGTEPLTLRGDQAERIGLELIRLGARAQGSPS